MSTRSRIGILQKDGSVKSIYCHWDGYPEGVGKTLQEHYKDRKEIEKLMELGDISSLGDHYDEEISTADWTKFDEPDKEKREELIKRSENCTIAYKDRGENSPARIDEDESEFISKLGKNWEEWTYLYKKDIFGVYRWHIVETPFFRSLEDELKNRGAFDNTEKDMGIDIVNQLNLGEDGAKLEFN